MDGRVLGMTVSIKDSQGTRRLQHFDVPHRLQSVRTCIVLLENPKILHPTTLTPPRSNCDMRKPSPAPLTLASSILSKDTKTNHGGHGIAEIQAQKLEVKVWFFHMENSVDATDTESQATQHHS